MKESCNALVDLVILAHSNQESLDLTVSLVTFFNVLNATLIFPNANSAWSDTTNTIGFAESVQIFVKPVFQTTTA